VLIVGDKTSLKNSELHWENSRFPK